MKLDQSGLKPVNLLAAVVFVLSATSSAVCSDLSTTSFSKSIEPVLKNHCFDCHNEDSPEGGLNLKQLKWDLENPRNRERWILIHDRVKKGEMPPDQEFLKEKEAGHFLEELGNTLFKADFEEVQSEGRGPIRRLNRVEYESNMRKILSLPHLDIKDMLPEDREDHLFNKSAKALDVSRVQLEAYLNAAEEALLKAVATGVTPGQSATEYLPATRMFSTAQTYGGREAMFYAKASRLIPLSGGDLAAMRKKNEHDPEIEMALFRSPSWPYYGYPDTFIAKEPGSYQIRFSARAVRQLRDFTLKPGRKPQPMTFRARKRSGPDVSGDVRATGGILDILPKQKIYETTIRLKKNETFEYSLLGLPVPRAINPKKGLLYYDFPPMPEGGHPGVAFQWLEVTGPIQSEQWPPPSHKILFDDLPIRPAETGRLKIELVSEQPESDAKKLIRRFIQHASREPIEKETVQIYERLALGELQKGTPLAEALIVGYSAFLCSPEFLYLPEPTPGENSELNIQFAIASRLSHFLSNSGPDEKLLSLAKQGMLRDKPTLEAEVNRLVVSEDFHQFILNFTDYWLSLKQIRRDEPDVRLYPEYRFDDYLIESLEKETRIFFKMMVQENLPVTALIDSDFILVNDRLSRHYELEPVSGSHLRKIKLPENSPYGGLLTQGAIMKVTANGSVTSPVIRGAWIMERLLGDPPPPPPKSVPAVEPNIRGATTIREQLKKHTSDESCASCHARFDPVGFALENYDIMGAWRNSYRSLNKGEKITGIDRAGHDFIYFVSVPVDASGQLRDGRKFQGIRELKTILKSEPEKLARNLLYQLTVYSTGTPVRFSDRPVIESILKQTQYNGYRIRDLITGLVQSRIFLGEEKQLLSENNQ